MGSRPDWPVVEGESLKPAPEAPRALSHRWDYSLVRELLTAQAEGSTCSLRVEAEGAGVGIHFRQGELVFVSGGLPSDSLGRMLLQQDLISEQQLAEIVEKRMTMQGRKRFGEVAVDVEALDRSQLEASLDGQLRAKLTRCLTWTRGDLRRVDGEHEWQPVSLRPLRVEPLVLEGICEFFDEDRVQDVLAPCWSHGVSLYSSMPRVVTRFALRGEDATLLKAALEAPSLGQFLCSGPARGERAGHLLCALALTDQLEMPRPTSIPPAIPAPARLPVSLSRIVQQADNDINNLAPATGKGGRQVARLQLLRRGSSSVPIAREEGPRNDPRSGDFALPSTPPTASPSQRPRSLASQDKLMADSAFLQGRELLRAGQHSAAADALKTASALRPGAREYALLAAWAVYLDGDRAEPWRKRLEKLCDAALAQDEQLALGHHVRGQLALADGDTAAARSSFGRAVSLDPHDDVARAALNGLSR